MNSWLKDLFITSRKGKPESLAIGGSWLWKAFCGHRAELWGSTSPRLRPALT